jgi:hypothetical protein
VKACRVQAFVMGVRTVLVRAGLPSHPLPNWRPTASGAHFLRAIQALGQQQNLVLRDAIYTANGVRLAAKGMRIDAVLYDKLVNERLRLPIDDLLSATGWMCPRWRPRR